ncbi:MAG: hypothetical protein DRO87_11200 [Candidatus Thorarchaeota archaeon]|nr:MAG: hypothetical protein DRO87_11200 [Candidatus Thorarchaeota archaeon]
MKLGVYTVSGTILPVAEYTGNGVTTVFVWTWDMIEDSEIDVLVDGQSVDGWRVESLSVVFDLPPEDQSLIQIYRRTSIHMPENYRAFGRFPANKTELSVDRAYMIAQEIAGVRGDGNAAQGIVGAANLYAKTNEFSVELISERGEDTFIPMWTPDDLPPPPVVPPDPSILWGGDPLEVGKFSTDGIGAETIFRFYLADKGNDPTRADIEYHDLNAFSYEDWVDNIPGDGDYWIRVFRVNPVSNKVFISNGQFEAEFEVPFKLEGFSNDLSAYLTVYTYGLPAPVVVSETFRVDICKDDGGLPDGNWASRNVIMEALHNG